MNENHKKRRKPLLSSVKWLAADLLRLLIKPKNCPCGGEKFNQGNIKNSPSGFHRGTWQWCINNSIGGKRIFSVTIEWSYLWTNCLNLLGSQFIIDLLFDNIIIDARGSTSSRKQPTFWTPSWQDTLLHAGGGSKWEVNWHIDEHWS